jgi:hypothetical protein
MVDRAETDMERAILSLSLSLKEKTRGGEGTDLEDMTPGGEAMNMQTNAPTLQASGVTRGGRTVMLLG